MAPSRAKASSASLTNSESASESAYAATEAMPASRAARITLTAISPRLAIRTFEMVVLPTLASLSRILCRGV